MTMFVPKRHGTRNGWLMIVNYLRCR